MLPKQSGPRRAMRRLRWQLRALVGRDIKPRVDIRCATDGRQASDGGWSVCPIGLNEKSIVYSFGIGYDIAWDRYIIERFGATVHAFDPTPQSLEWLRRQKLPDQFIVHPIGLADYDGEAKFSPPEKAHHVDHTMLARPTTEHRGIAVPVSRLTTIMQSLGHTTIDLLKMDIEGAEYSAITNIIKSQISINQWLIEFHHRFPNVGTRATKNALDELRAAGYRIFTISDSGQEYGFLRAA